jgi:hypothetical protein
MKGHPIICLAFEPERYNDHFPAEQDHNLPLSVFSHTILCLLIMTLVHLLFQHLNQSVFPFQIRLPFTGPNASRKGRKEWYHKNSHQ